MPAWRNAVLDEIQQERLPARRHRRNKRGVKRKMSNFPIRRKSDKPLPPVNILKAIRIVTSVQLEAMASGTAKRSSARRSQPPLTGLAVRDPTALDRQLFSESG